MINGNRKKEKKSLGPCSLYFLDLLAKTFQGLVMKSYGLIIHYKNSSLEGEDRKSWEEGSEREREGKEGRKGGKEAGRKKGR